ncbi:MAG: hypothetical protein ACKPKO_43680, partial [Candidatus Fonsibacter sp.]
SSSGPVPPQPPIYPPAQPQVHTVPVIPISSSSDRHIAPSELDQAGEDYFRTVFQVKIASPDVVLFNKMSPSHVSLHMYPLNPLISSQSAHNLSTNSKYP